MTTELLAVVAVLIAPLVGYLAASRRLSGKIATSDAEQLWAESKAIREDYRGQIISANKRVARLEERVVVLEQHNSDLSAENEVLRKQVAEYETKVKRLQARVAHLEAENARLNTLLSTQAHETLEALEDGDDASS